MTIEPRTLKPSMRRRQAVAEAWEQQRYLEEVGSTSRMYFRDAWPSFLLAGPDPCTRSPKPEARNNEAETRNPKSET